MPTDNLCVDFDDHEVTAVDLIDFETAKRQLIDATHAKPFASAAVECENANTPAEALLAFAMMCLDSPRFGVVKKMLDLGKENEEKA